MSHRDTNTKAQLRGRRGFLKLLSGLGVSAALLNNISQKALAKMDINLDKEIPFIDRYEHTNRSAMAEGGPPQRDPIYDAIDRSKWSEIEAAHVAANKINARINSLRSSKSGSPLITASVTSTSDGKAIQITHKEKHKQIVPEEKTQSRDASVNKTRIRRPSVSREKIEREFPSEISGKAQVEKADFKPDSRTFPIIVESETVHDTGQCKRYHFNGNHAHDIPAGCKMHGDGNGTLGTRAYHDGLSDAVMVTAGHAFTDSNSMHQPKKGWLEHQDGESHTAEYDNGNGDYALVKAPHDHDGWKLYNYKLADDSGGNKDVHINGIITWDSIKYNEGDDDWTVERQGARTGLETGSITGTHTNNGKFVKTDIAQGKGDSGGAVFRRETVSGAERIYIVSINTKGYGSSGSNCKFDTSGGNAMEYIENEEGLTV